MLLPTTPARTSDCLLLRRLKADIARSQMGATVDRTPLHNRQVAVLKRPPEFASPTHRRKDSCAFARKYGTMYHYARMHNLVGRERNTVAIVWSACCELKKQGIVGCSAYGRRRRIHRFWSAIYESWRDLVLWSKAT